jgi:hypothetical protein
MSEVRKLMDVSRFFAEVVERMSLCVPGPYRIAISPCSQFIVGEPDGMNENPRDIAVYLASNGKVENFQMLRWDGERIVPNDASAKLRREYPEIHLWIVEVLMNGAMTLH